MSVKIRYPFPQYAKLFHNLGLKFVEQERAWVGYDVKKDIIVTKVPEEVKDWVNEFFSFHDSLTRLKTKIGTIVDQSAQDPKFMAWSKVTEEESLQSCYRAQEESELRKQILLQVKIDFSHPKVKIEQGGGYGLSKDSGIIYIRGAMDTYHREGLSSLFHMIGWFSSISETRIKNGDFKTHGDKKPTHFQETLHQLKVLALTETLSDYYQIKRSDRSVFLEAMAENPDSELFFQANMHLVAKFSGDTAEDRIEDQISYQWFTEKEGLSPEEAQKQVNYISSQILQRRHKVQVLAAFFETKLADKYTIDHIKFMFSQQLPFLD